MTDENGNDVTATAPNGKVSITEASRSDNYESYRDFLSFVIELAENGCVFQSASQLWEDGDSFDITYKVQTDVVKIKRQGYLYSKTELMTQDEFIMHCLELRGDDLFKGETK
jgi:hypothetical protein